MPRTYAVTYRLDTGGSTSTETLSVRRPFDGRVDIDGAVSASTFGRLLLAAGGTANGVLASPPAPAYGDVRIDIALADALASHVVTRLDTATIAGRRCQRYRAGGPPEAAQLVADAGADDGVVFCVDRDGLLLEERTLARGRVVRDRRATRVEVDVPLDDASFATDGDTVPVSAGGGSVQRLTDDSRTPGDFWELGAVPSGFRHRGRFAVVPPQVEGTQPGHESARVAGVVDVYERGVDVVMVDRGGTLGGVPAFAADGDVPSVALGDLGTAEEHLGFVVNELRVLQPGGHYVRVLGTVPMRALVAIARDVHLVAGGSLTTVP